MADVTHFVFITGGLCPLLQIKFGALGVLARGYGKARTDPYLNVDPGTMSPPSMGKFLSLMMGQKPI